MADFSKITSPTGAEFVVKDTTARADISTLTSTVAGKITNPSGGTAGQVLTKTANGEEWATPSGGGNVDTVNGISPDANKNVQTSVELTQAQYEALPSSKLTDNVEYFLTDGNDNPLNNTVMASGVAYDNTDSGLSAENVQDAVDELKNGLIPFPDYSASGILYDSRSSARTLNYTATEDCYANFYVVMASTNSISINGELVASGSDSGTSPRVYQVSFAGYLKAGDVITSAGVIRGAIFKLR